MLPRSLADGDTNRALVLAAVCAIAFFSGVVKGTALLGFGLTAAPLLATVLTSKDVLVALVLPALCMDVLLATGNRATIPARRLMAPLIVAGLIGTTLGTLIIDGVDERVLAVGIGVAVIAFTALGSMARDGSGSAVGYRTRLLGPCVGFVAGVTGFFGPPVIAYLQHLGLAKQALAATAGLTFACLGIFRLLNMTMLGLVTTPRLATSAVVLLPGIAGFAVGCQARRLVSEGTFNRLVKGLIVSSAGLLILRNVSL